MNGVALRMLLGDRANYIGLIFRHRLFNNADVEPGCDLLRPDVANGQPDPRRQRGRHLGRQPPYKFKFLKFSSFFASLKRPRIAKPVHEGSRDPALGNRAGFSFWRMARPGSSTRASSARNTIETFFAFHETIFRLPHLNPYSQRVTNRRRVAEKDQQ